MSVVIETTLGDLTVDLFLSDRPRACLNFLKLCKIKYYNFSLFHTISRSFIAQTGDPTGSRTGGQSIYGLINGPEQMYFEGEKEPRIKHTKMGLISYVGDEDAMIGSQFFITLGEELTYLDANHCVFGEVVEGFDILEAINEVICDSDDRPYQDVRITHTVVLDDPYPDPKMLKVPSRSPSPSAERLQGGRIAPDEEIDETEGKDIKEVNEMEAEREAKARATILEMVGDIPDADIAPPENVLFVCKLNPVTTDDDLEVIFNRFGKIKSCEVIRDKKTGDSLQYAFIEFAERKSCEDAYFKMDNILIDDRRIHVDFSQSVSKMKWHGKGRGVTYYNNKNSDTEKHDFPETSRKDRNRDNFRKHESNSRDYRKHSSTQLNSKSTGSSRRAYSSRRSRSVSPVSSKRAKKTRHNSESDCEKKSRTHGREERERSRRDKKKNEKSSSRDGREKYYSINRESYKDSKTKKLRKKDSDDSENDDKYGGKNHSRDKSKKYSRDTEAGKNEKNRTKMKNKSSSSSSDSSDSEKKKPINKKYKR